MTARKPEQKPGPEAETLAIDGNWEEAVKKATAKAVPKKPAHPKGKP
ncbi:MAG: hypothetical protein KA267_04615 [Gemmatimonadales bacterium]|nr:hypothetical protein [Gemmatimonadales bacterium]MBP6570259.1 hypothetical protein [Gemmatimonadales bacterium]MBP9896998.1 hypothetical protein [Gemmatimonadales bacterium]